MIPSTTVPPDLCAIKKQCAQRLFDRLRDPLVRAEKGQTFTPLGEVVKTTSSQALPLQRVASEGRLGTTDSARPRERHSNRCTQEHNCSDSESARGGRSIARRSISRRACSATSHRRPCEWQSGVASQATPRTSSKGNKAQLTQKPVQPLTMRVARTPVLDSPRSRNAPVGGSSEEARLPGRADTAALRETSPSRQMVAAMALRRLVAPSTATLNKATAVSESDVPNVVAPCTRCIPRATSAERIVSTLDTVGSKGQQDVRELAGTLQRLCELEDERRRLFEEYDGMLARAAASTQPLPSSAASHREAPHAADVSAGGAWTSQRGISGSPKPKTSSYPTSSTPAGSARRALSAATDRADLQLSELLRKSDRLRSLLADFTTTS